MKLDVYKYAEYDDDDDNNDDGDKHTKLKSSLRAVINRRRGYEHTINRNKNEENPHDKKNKRADAK